MNTSEGRGRAGRVIVALACLYGPYAWLLAEFPPSSYTLGWVRMWPVLPGLLVHMVPGVHRMPESFGHVAMGLTTTPLLAIVVVTAWRSRRWGLPVSLMALVLSVVNSWIAYQLYLA